MTAVASSEDPHTLLSRLSLADSTSPSGVNSPVPTTPEANVAHLARVQARRVAKVARAETALWKPITVEEAAREIDPEKVLKGKTISLGQAGLGRIVKRAARNVFLVDGEAWQIQLEGFHHYTDEEEAQDPLTAASPYALQTSSLWDILFESHLLPGEIDQPVLIREATYGLRTEDGESAVGLGIKWVRKTGDLKAQGGWAWIWGELDDWDEDEDEDEEEGEKEVSEVKPLKKRFKGVHLTKLVEEEDGEAEEDPAAGQATADEVGQNGDE